MIRSLTDSQGQAWQATVGRESYGMQVILFFPDGGGDARKALMSSNTRLEAFQELASMADEELLEKLETSQGWEEETTFLG